MEIIAGAKESIIDRLLRDWYCTPLDIKILKTLNKYIL